VPEIPHERTDAAVKALIVSMGYSLNLMSGVPGVFYTTNREVDLRAAAEDVLENRLNRLLDVLPYLGTK
jgi:hypothetical protein